MIIGSTIEGYNSLFRHFFARMGRKPNVIPKE
jgi:IS1 family transposase